MKIRTLVCGAIALSFILPVAVHADEATTTGATPTEAITTLDDTVVSDTASSSTQTPPSETDTLSTPLPIPDPVTIDLEIDSESAQLWHGPITVSACPPSPSSTSSTVNAYCAVQQTGLLNTWSWYGSDAFLDSINGVANNYGSGSYWTWFSDLVLGSVALNKHELVPGENLLITIGRMPLAIVVSSTTPLVATTTTIAVTQFAFDPDFNPVWIPATTSVVHIGETLIPTDDHGVATFAATSTDPLDVFATLESFLPSSHVLVIPIDAPPAIVPVSESSTSTQSSGNGPPVSSGGGSGPAAPKTADIAAAIAFLSRTVQNEHVYNTLLDDWTVIALSSDPAGRDALESMKPTLAIAALTHTTDHERRAMALEAADGSTTLLTPVINSIIQSYDGVQIGDPSLLNDDIFALLPLTHAGFDAHTDVVRTVVHTILSKQQSDGSWENVDLTAAAIQALSPLTAVEGVSSALSRARTYLLGRERSDGCFGNVYTTSWVVQAIVSLGEKPSQWTSLSGGNPLTCLAELQQGDGGFGSVTDSEENRIWATAYAIPALKEVSWDMLMHFYPLNVPTVRTGSVDASVVSDVPSPATSTTEDVHPITDATTTQAVSTTTEETHMAAQEMRQRVTPQKRPTQTRDSVPIVPQSDVPAKKALQLAAASIATPTLFDHIAEYMYSLWDAFSSLFEH